jgi:hypothetical protein
MSARGTSCSYCGEAVRWVRDADPAGSRLVLDAAPSDAGTVVLDVPHEVLTTPAIGMHAPPHAGPRLSPLAAAGARAAGHATYTPHADRCPFASTWNRPLANKAPRIPLPLQRSAPAHEGDAPLPLFESLA